ncbi:MAG TPA: antitermination protein NusB [Frateuria sp.]|uniref:antitermination protein NusB n=1 Tax=Frateuria sp. TaxID=2211372 RepID=UPI002DE2E108|nr:antitermination protein NusB [Frateuria sp.]HEV2621599.1 antitermination protein NusB [Frateuria sp.]
MDQFSRLADVQAAPWFVGWGTLALINAGLAQGKNRSGLLWFLLSLVFGPLATLVLVLLPKVRQKLF